MSEENNILSHSHSHLHSHELSESTSAKQIQILSKETALAVLQNMYAHNGHHSEELCEIAGALPNEFRDKLLLSAGELDAANESLKAVLDALLGSDEKLFSEESLKKTPEKGASYNHGHFHDPKEKSRRITRLSRAIGHLGFVKRMMEEDADCSEILMQLSAVESALKGLGKSIISEHMTHCIVHAVEDGDTKAIEEFQSAIQKYL